MADRFLDTSALKHRYIRSPQRRWISRLVSSRRGRCYIADVTILEMASALGGACRSVRKGLRTYDLMDRRFLADVADGRLTVRPANFRTALRARHLLRFGGVIKGKNLGSADALIASCCLDLAHELKQRLVFYTADWNLYMILRDIDAFRSAMTLQYILPPKHGIPERT